MRPGNWIVATGAIALLLWAPSATEAKPRVSLELVTEPGFPITGSQQWYKLLTEMGVTSLRIRGATVREEVTIEKQGTAEAPAFKVIGILSPNNVLHLPGGNFTLQDGARLRKWLDELGDQGIAGVTQPKSAFDLTQAQLEQVNNDLKKLVDFSTAGVPLPQAVEKLRGQLGFALTIEPEAADAMDDVVVAEQLRGLSSGTVLAIMLRPAGLVFQPERPRGGQLQYRIGKPREGRESWPAGWKPDEPARKVLPDLFESINVEITGIPVSQALGAIQERLKVPFLYDHNALALHGIDPAKVEAAVPSKRLSYSLILQKLLFQARLKSELRIDEAGQPFFWITTLKPA